MVLGGDFRRDLYHRLKVLNIHIPPLREHLDDIPLLAESFLHRYARAHGRKVGRISYDAINTLICSQWPGNIRELENLIEQAVILCPDGQAEITANLLLPEFAVSGSEATGQTQSLREAEGRHIRIVLQQTGGNKSAAARILEIDYKTLLRKLAAMR
jgi:transcriptional regulator with PAS, ATPase and Fis domain